MEVVDSKGVTGLHVKVDGRILLLKFETAPEGENFPSTPEKLDRKGYGPLGYLTALDSTFLLISCPTNL